ncbi:Nucleoside triphosphatase NudI [Diplonema papillatum]|nr:Nucleoside triphosphatase NudI [Diplonema papillatum]
MQCRVAAGGAEAFVPEYGSPIVTTLAAAAGGGLRKTSFYEVLDVTAETDAREVVLRKGRTGKGKPVPLGRAAANSGADSVRLFGKSVMCPLEDLRVQAVTLGKRHAFPKVGAVVVPRHGGKTLVTRRPTGMRTFPRAWIFPGGSIDEGETADAAALRELKEETGLDADPDSLSLFAVWESVYPTTAEACIAMNQVAGHFVVLFYEATVQDPASLKLCPDEVDDHVWVPDADWHAICSHPTPDQKRLHGIYPNDTGEGIGQGHLFAVDVLFGLQQSLSKI